MRRGFFLMAALGVALPYAAFTDSEVVAAPPNDDFANAEVVVGATVAATGSNVDATKEPGEPDHAGNTGGASIWYRWVAPTSGATQVEVCDSYFDTVLAVYTGDDLAALVEVASNDDGDACTGTGSSVVFDAVATTTYQIAVDGYAGSSGTVQLGIAPSSEPPDPDAPPNDDFVNAVVLEGDADTASGTNAEATPEPGEPEHAGIGGTTSVWYRWTAPSTGRAVLDTCGSDFDTVLAVYTGPAVDSLTEVTSDDDSCGDRSIVVFDAVAAVTYRIAVAGAIFDTGLVELELSRLLHEDLDVVATVDFGRVTVGAAVDRTVTLHNVGERPLEVSSVTLRTYPFAAGEYHVVTDQASGSSIPAGGTRDVVLRFTPTTNATGPVAAVSTWTLLDGFTRTLVSYRYDEQGVRTGDIVWHYLRNVGGRGTVTYRATASNDTGGGFVTSDEITGTVTLRAGEYYAVSAVSPYAGAVDAAAQDLYLPISYHDRRVVEPLWPTDWVSGYGAVESVAFVRMGDAMLVVDSSDPTPGAVSAPNGFDGTTPTAAIRLLGEGRAVCPGYETDARNQVVGTTGRDTLIGTTGADIVCGLDGDDVLEGRGGDDVLLGGGGDDTIRGQIGRDRIVGGPGADVVYGGDQGDTILGESGADRLSGGGSGDVVTGGLGADRLLGDAGDDELRSRDGLVDVVDGGSGRDVGIVDRSDDCLRLEVRRLP